MSKTAIQVALPAALAASLIGVGFAAPAAIAGPGAGPASAKCGKFKKKAQKKRCQKQNQANRIAFNQIKDSQFVGVRGDGEEIEDVYCANGKFEARATDSTYGTGVSTGRHWTIVNAKVKRGGKWIDAFLKGTGGYEIALQRRGAQWKYGIASFGRILEPGNVEKTSATRACAALEV
jgi:hypothetical protein